MGIISNKLVTVAPALLTKAGETLSNGDLVSMVDNKLYELPQSVDTITTVLNFTRSSSNSSVISTIMQGGAKILLVYANNSGYPEARLYHTTDDGIQQVGTTFVINAATANYLKVFKLSEEYVLVYYTTGAGASAIPYICVLKITGNTISIVGSATTCLATGIINVNAATLNYDGDFYRLVLYGSGYDTNISPYTQIVKISNTGILTKGNALIWSGYKDKLKIAILNENSFVLYGFYSSTIYLRAYNVSDTTITGGAQVTLGSLSSTNIIDIVKIDINRCYIYYAQAYSSNVYTIKHRIISISGTTITFETEYLMGSVISINNSVLIDNNKIMLIYRKEDNLYYAKIYIADGTVIDDSSDEVEFNSANTTYVERYGNKYLSNSTGTYAVSVSGTDIIMQKVTDFDISAYQSYTPYKYFSFTIDTTAANNKAILYIFTGLFEPTGYVISDSRFVSNTVQKAAYIPF